MSTKIKTRMIGVRLDAKLTRAVRVYAASHDTSIQEVVRRSLIAFLKAAIVFAFVACRSAHEATPADSSQDAIVVGDSDDVAIDGSIANLAAWGDSLTQGIGAPAADSYPSDLTGSLGYAVFNGGVSGNTSTQIRTRMIADTTKVGWPVIIWAGRNNWRAPAIVEDDIAAMVASLGHTHYFVLSVPNGDVSTEWAGGVDYAGIMKLNANLEATYADRFIDVRALLVARFDPALPQDVIDHGHDVPSASLRRAADWLHYNAAGYRIVASEIFARIIPQ